MCEIKNTVMFRFSHGDAKPDMGEIVNFAKSLDANPKEMDTVYRIAEERAIYIKFKSEEAMLHALTFNSDNLIFQYGNGNRAEVHMSQAGEFIQYVRVYDLPPEVSDNELTLVLGKYGKVKRAIREKFPSDLCFDLYTGVRGVYMDVQKEIPTSLHFLNRKGNIFYDGNKNKCFLCKTDGHQMSSCPKRKTKKQPPKQPEKTKSQHQDKKQNNSSSTYAGVVVEGSNLNISNHEPKKLEVLNEIIELDVTAPITAEMEENDVYNQQQRSRFRIMENIDQIRA